MGIPVIDLQGDQNPDDNQDDLTQAIEEVVCQPTFLDQLSPDTSKEFEHAPSRIECADLNKIKDNDKYPITTDYIQLHTKVIDYHDYSLIE